jgi:protein-L-isoaspartate(D-aspartate) O-methyltransferase
LDRDRKVAMNRQAELDIIRAAYARHVLGAAVVEDERLAAAFAAIHREDFLGSPPWPIIRWFRNGDYVPSPDDDPVHLYTDVLVGIVPERRLNNGQPSLHALLMHHAAPAAGDHVVHIGTGSGYYTAIFAHLAGAAGRVTGIEYEAEVAARAQANLAPYTNVRVVQGDGTTAAFDKADVIYVNAGCTRPAETWLDRLADGGRLILPLTSGENFGSLEAEQMRRSGAVFRIVRRGDEYFANRISAVAIFPCAGNRDEASEQVLAEAFAKEGLQRVTRLYRHEDIPDDRCWVRGPGWALAYS